MWKTEVLHSARVSHWAASVESTLVSIETRIRVCQIWYIRTGSLTFDHLQYANTKVNISQRGIGMSSNAEYL